MAEGQGDHYADTGNGHQAARRLIRPRQLANFVVELVLLLTNMLMDQQERRYHAKEWMTIVQ
ncbi:hypothetical protein ACM41_14430 [Bradyrhizobium sp. CCBAU 21362]|nr:hypothetical protein [Bradyrhizobium sp. CCBAU 21362]